MFISKRALFEMALVLERVMVLIEKNGRLSGKHSPFQWTSDRYYVIYLVNRTKIRQADEREMSIGPVDSSENQ
jgi:hypothetical protein